MTSSADTKAKQAQALELHLAGIAYQQIAERLGFNSAGYAHKLVQQALDALTMPASTPIAGEHAASMARLDAMLAGVWPKARRGDLQSIDRVLKIEERRLALQALAARTGDAPAPAKKETGLSDFEKRLRARESRATRARRTKAN